MSLQESQFTKPLADLWSPGEDFLLKTLIEQGVRFADIANEIGRPRGACIGRANRLGFRHPDQTRNPVQARIRRMLEPYPLPPSVDEPVPANANLKPFLELKFDECKYPYGETALGESLLFCGAPRTHRAYCKFHHDLTHRKVNYES